jgi:hypothetical protein
MLVWFIFRDAPGEPWQSGLVDQYGQAKPALASFAAASLPAARELHVTADAASPVQAFRIPALELRSRVAAGARVGIRYTLEACGQVLGGGYLESRMGSDGWVPIKAALHLSSGVTYRLGMYIDAAGGGGVERQVALRVGTGTGAGSCPRT